MKNLSKIKPIFFIILFLFLIPNFVLATNNYSADFEKSSNQYLSGGDILDITASTTVSMWFNLESALVGGAYTMEQTLLSKYSSSNQRSYWLAYSKDGSNNPAFVIVNSANGIDSTIAEVPVSIGINTWYHLTIQFLPAIHTVKIYLGSATSTPTLIKTDTAQVSSYYNSTTGFQIGGISQQSNYFDGIIDDVRWFDSELSLSQITDYYDCDLDAELLPTHHWKFENNFNDTIGAYNLTNNNSVSFLTNLPYTQNCFIPEEPAPLTAAIMYMEYPDDISNVHRFTTEYNASGTIIGYIKSDEYHPFNQFLFWVIVEAFIAFVLIYFHLLYEKKKKRF